jgi:invasion protein IalB
MSILSRSLLAAVLIALPIFPALADDPAPTLPGGANTLTEQHGDWTVRCGVTAPAAGTAGASSCSVSQQQVDKTTKRRVLIVALAAGDNGGVKGSLVMPFGLDLDSGVTLQIDDGPVTAAAHFKTCLPAGCVIPVDWPAATVKALRTAQKLKAAAKGENGQPAQFTISMTGFASALDRAIKVVAAK